MFHTQVEFSTTEQKLFLSFQLRSRHKLDSQRPMLCLLQVLDTSIPWEVKSMDLWNKEFHITTWPEKAACQCLQLFKKLRSSMEHLKELKTSLPQVSFKLFTLEFPLWEKNQIDNIKTLEIDFLTSLKLAKMNKQKLIEKSKPLKITMRRSMLTMLSNVED